MIVSHRIKLTYRFLFVGGLMGLLCTQATLFGNDEDGWVRFRGPNGAGLSSEGAALATEWNWDANLKWKLELTGKGSSSPIILGDKIFLTSYSGYGLERETPGDPRELVRHVICIDTAAQKVAWQVDIPATDEDVFEGFIQEHGYASSTPVTDGKHLFVFLGKSGVLAFDLEGKELWRTTVGTQSDPAKWGGGSSLILVGNVLVVNAGNEGRSIVGLDKNSGDVKWKIEDDTFGNSWSTPVLVDVNGRTETVFSMPGKVLAINSANGEVFWEAESPVTNTTCASLAEGNGVVYAMGGRGGQAIAIRCGGSGDVTSTHVVWQKPLAAGIGTPIFVNGRLYWNSRGIAYCADAATGEYIYRERLKAEQPAGEQGQRRSPAGDYASPIAIGDNVILTQRNGQVFILSSSSAFNLVASNQFPNDDSLFNATPAVNGTGELIFRSEKMLYCLGPANQEEN